MGRTLHSHDLSHRRRRCQRPRLAHEGHRQPRLHEGHAVATMTITTTTWHRLEPRVRGGDPAVGLRAAIHDPLWLLGRQWQMGELLGEDAAFPVAVRVETDQSPLSRFRPGDPGNTPVNYDPSATPLEVTVER